ncbi:MAG: phage shock protein E [Glaciecola sp.]|jgi:phage shock protein E
MSKQRVVRIGVITLMFISGFNLLASSCTSQTEKSQQQETKSESLSDIIKGDAFLVDVRTPGEYKNGHVEGSVNIPLATVSSNIEKFKGKGNIVVFCQSGGRSSKAKKILDNDGIKNVTNGGGWESVNAIVKKK